MLDAARRRSLLTVYLLSGAPGLMAQMAWARVFTAGLGHELPALLGVTTAFLLGLAGGARALDARLARSTRPLAWYAGLELASAGGILAGLPWLDELNSWAVAFLGPTPAPGISWLLALAIPALVVGPSAFAMGATFPAMERAAAPLVPGHRGVALLYGFNTAGAVAGLWASVAWLMPDFGFRATLLAAAGIQALCAVAALGLHGSDKRLPGAGRDSIPRESKHGASASPSRPFLWFAAGALALAYQWTVVRVVQQVLENTVQTFALCLGCYLAGTALGAWGARHWERRRAALPSSELLLGLAALVAAELWVLHWAPGIWEKLDRSAGIRVAEWGMAMLAFVLPSVAMGALFSTLVQGAKTSADGVGKASGWNTLGAAMGGPLVAMAAIPGLGMGGSLVVVVVGYLGLSVLVGGITWVRMTCVVGVVMVVGLSPRSLVHVEVGSKDTVTRAVEGALATVAVVRSPDGQRTLRVNNRFQQGGTAAAVAARRQGHLPLLLHPEPHRALFLGVGTGLSLGTVDSHPGLTADGVELLPEVVSVLDAFEPENGAPGRSSRVRIHQADARRFVRATTGHYDVIVADLYHPAEDGAGLLYTREHFEALRRRLAPGGLVCQWLPLHQMDLPVFRDIARTFSGVYPHHSLWLLRFNVDVPVVGLVGSETPMVWDSTSVARRLAHGELARELGPLALNSPLRILGCLVADGAVLDTMAATGEVATDDRPSVLFRAPRWLYHRRGIQEERPADRLLAVLESGTGDLRRVFKGEWEADEVRRVSDFQRARDLHLSGLANESAGRLERAIELYLASTSASPEYTAGYAQAVLVASAYLKEKPDLASGLLRRLVELRPEQRLARDLLERTGK